MCIELKWVKDLNDENLVPIDLRIVCDGTYIKEQFLWEASNTNQEIMRHFGLQILSEKLGRTAFGDLSQDSVRRFGQSVCEVISLNVNMYNRLNMSEFLGRNKQDKITDNHQNPKLPEAVKKSDLGSPILKIYLRLHKESGELIEDSFFWDLTCDLNHPESFAKMY